MNEYYFEKDNSKTSTFLFSENNLAVGKTIVFPRHSYCVQEYEGLNNKKYKLKGKIYIQIELYNPKVNIKVLFTVTFIFCCAQC